MTKLIVGNVTITIETASQPIAAPAGALSAYMYTEWTKDQVIGRLQQQEAENIKLANRCDEIARARDVMSNGWSALLTKLGVPTQRDAIEAIELLKAGDRTHKPRKSKTPDSAKKVSP
jgi:hypothetical protein